MSDITVDTVIFHSFESNVTFSFQSIGMQYMQVLFPTVV